MSRPAPRERRDEPRGGTRYEDDLYTWVQEQVALLQAGRLTEIDARNIAEELGDVGKSEYRELQSALTLILTHMLKWDHQPERRTRSWDNSIDLNRRNYAEVLADNPGLKSRRGEALLRASGRARLVASSETGLPKRRFPLECPYGWDEIPTRDFDFDSPGEQH
jgi:hypothetical protein